MATPAFWKGLRYIGGVLFALLMFLPLSVDAQSVCPVEVENCVNLFDANTSLIQIESIEAVSDLPVFVNPMLSVRFRVVGRGLTAPLTVMMPVVRLSNILPDSQEAPRHCQLWLVGFDENNQFTDRYVVNRLNESVTVRVYAFCDRVNIPGVREIGLPFPNKESRLFGGNLDQINVGDYAEIQQVMARVINGDCVSEDKPLTMQSLATQFAIFILNTPPANRDAMQDVFVDEAKNAIYTRDREAIYCLLQDVSIQNPPTPTPTPTPTPPETATPTLIATPTPTLIPLAAQQFFTENPRLPNTLTLPMLAGILGGLLIGSVFLLSIIRTTRQRVLLLLVLVIGIIAYSLWTSSQLGAPPDPQEITHEN